MDRVVAAIAVGSNLGNREGHLAFARQRLASALDAMRFSSIHQTAPVDVPGRQRPFLNAAAVGTTALAARDFLEWLLSVERERGRERPFPGAARTLDLDLILFGDAIVTEPGLVVPHPRFRDRLFVLAPLAEVAPTLVDPVTSRTVVDLLSALQDRDAASRRSGSPASR